MVKLMFGNKEKIVLLTIIAILLLAASTYIGERFRPYKITANVGHYIAEQLATENTSKIARNIGSYTVRQIATSDTHKKVHHRASATTRHIRYVVKKGDTIWNLSQKYKVNPELLKFANNIGSSSKITIGQKLTIPKNG